MTYDLKRVAKYVLFCIFQCVAVAILMILLIRTPFFATQRIYLYRLLQLLAICFIVLLAACIGVFAKRNTIFGISFSETLLCLVASMLFMTLFFSLGPMTIERSYTIYSLADMSDHSNKIYTAEDIKTQFIEGYIEGANESQKRIDEQVAIGNLEQKGEGYCISDKGERLVKLYRFIEMLYPVPDKSSIYPGEIE